MPFPKRVFPFRARRSKISGMYSPFGRDATIKMLSPFILNPDGLTVAELAAIVYADKQQDGFLHRSTAGNLGRFVKAQLLDQLGDTYTVTDAGRAALAELELMAPPEVPRARPAVPVEPEPRFDEVVISERPPAAPYGDWRQGSDGYHYSRAPDGGTWKTAGFPHPPRRLKDGKLWEYTDGKVISRKTDAWGRPLDEQGRLLERPQDPPPLLAAMPMNGHAPMQPSNGHAPMQPTNGHAPMQMAPAVASFAAPATNGPAPAQPAQPSGWQLGQDGAQWLFDGAIWWSVDVLGRPVPVLDAELQLLPGAPPPGALRRSAA
jgi:hypothetical protein